MLILITGASKGIGYEMVKEFSKNSAHLIIAVSRNISPLLKFVKDNNTTTILPLKANVSSKAQQQKIIKVLRSLGLPVDVVINNAGELVKKPFEHITEKELQNVYRANVFAPFLLIQSLLPFMNKQRASHIVNIGSMGGFQGSSKFSGLSAYTSSKGALAVLTECLAEELKPKNIHVNCLALGAVQTEMLSKAFPGYKAPLSAHTMAQFICHFALTGQQYYNGKILPVSLSTP
ncbi:MAG: SDR family NAD(P)-dependent oxidoreductase [bacterium]|nr:SDR family NAD(P)-dependent oxidoreductase [bacterium]